jgi:hypothetical protein
MRTRDSSRDITAPYPVYGMQLMQPSPDVGVKNENTTTSDSRPISMYSTVARVAIASKAKNQQSSSHVSAE